MNQPKFARDRIYRVKSNFNPTNQYGCGSGFFVSKTRLVTCFHVIFGKELRNLKSNPMFTALSGNNDHEKLQSYFSTEIRSMEVEISPGAWSNATLLWFNEEYDIALLDVSINGSKINICEIDWEPKINYGDHLFFAGFPIVGGYDIDKTPFAIHEGIVSSFPLVTVGGEKYEHLQINSINLGGNSGAPLFRKGKRKVIGIVNGNMNFGSDNVLVLDINTNQPQKSVFRVPLSVAYSTPLKLVRDKTDLLKVLKN